MEFILVVAVIAVLCIIFRVSMDIIIMCLVVLSCIVFTATALMFAFLFICLLFSEKCTAEFSKSDKSDKDKFSRAYYIIDGKEYPCIFPKEKFFSITFYDKTKKYNVRFNRKFKFLYDRFASATCIIGFSMSIIITAVTVILYLSV